MDVLIAEDDITTSFMLEKLLSKWKYSLTTVRNGQEAWDILQQENAPQLVIMDWQLAGLDGGDPDLPLFAGDDDAAGVDARPLSLRWDPDALEIRVRHVLVVGHHVVSDLDTVFGELVLLQVDDVRRDGSETQCAEDDEQNHHCE